MKASNENSIQDNEKEEVNPIDLTDPAADDNWLDALRSGNFFIKHHPWTAPKLRLIWVTTDLKEIHWADPKKPQLSKGLIRVSEISDIRDGITKGKTLSKTSNQTRYDNIFTLNTAKRTLELEAPTQESKNKWKEIFQRLLTLQK